uniref:Uncharacterized protein n=1 Tax=Rhizophora mucronata TaxID=61149 RepID=A0A2P2QMQ8_RHIMU
MLVALYLEVYYTIISLPFVITKLKCTYTALVANS